MTEPERLDALIIGTGQAGKPLAAALSGAGRKTAIIERSRVGGTCLITGCTPTKAMVASARTATVARRSAEFGVDAGLVSIDMERVRRRKRELVDSWSRSAQKGLEEKENLELVFGDAFFSGPSEVGVRVREGGERLFRAERIFVNAGARPRIPDIPGLSEVDALDSTSIMELGEAPAHLVILGGGFIGLEFAQMFKRFGSRVSVLERSSRLLTGEDEEVSEAIRKILVEDGIEIHLNVSVTAIERTDEGGVRVVTEAPSESVGSVQGSHLLLAVGRTPNTDGLAPGAAGLELDEAGYIKVNDRLETNVPGIWALGDINGGPPFTHIAYDDFRVVRTNLLEGGSASRSGRTLPYALFTDPELGRVGMTEARAREEGHRIRIARIPMAHVARAAERSETRGFMKAVVHADTGQILGAAVLGVNGGEIVSLLQVAMMGGLPWQELAEGIFIHPTLAESMNTLFSELEPQEPD